MRQAAAPTSGSIVGGRRCADVKSIYPRKLTQPRARRSAAGPHSETVALHGSEALSVEQGVWQSRLAFACGDERASYVRRARWCCAGQNGCRPHRLRRRAQPGDRWRRERRPSWREVAEREKRVSERERAES
eukprot:scaffold241262_cov31-Tisochrysis_lutea.AAC.3